jgi:hypothetical protein
MTREQPDLVLQMLVIGFIVVMLLAPFITFAALIIALAT